MNVRVTAGNQIQLPDEVVEALQLQPGSEVDFRRGPAGEILLVKTGDASEATVSDYAPVLRSMRGHAGPGESTHAILSMTRGEE